MNHKAFFATNELKLGTNWRWENGRARVSYHPDWSPSLPYVSYVNGAAWAHFGSIEAAAQHLGCDLENAEVS